MSICVFMWFNNKINDYAEINYKLNKIYCDNYGYPIIKCNQRRASNRKFHWERIPLILEHFDTYDYFVWIDADAHFYIDSPPISHVIDAHPEKLFIFTGGLTCEINSGFFIVKKSEESINILTKWLKDESLFNSPELSKPIFGSGAWNDQAVLRLMYSKNILDIQNKSIIIPYGILQHFNKQHTLKKQVYGLRNKPFIYHCTNGDNMLFKTRVQYSRDYYSTIQLNKYNSFVNSNIQLDKEVIKDILINCENKKMLVFGLGYDSELWYNCTNKNTFFVENDKSYIELNKNIPKDNIIYYEYNKITVNKSLDLIKSNTNTLNYPIPQKIIEHAPFDIILIDGPNGSNKNSPGRLLPVHWSQNYLSKQGTIIYIDDVNRELEKKLVNKYFTNIPKKYFKQRLGTMKIII